MLLVYESCHDHHHYQIQISMKLLVLSDIVERKLSSPAPDTLHLPAGFDLVRSIACLCVCYSFAS